MLVADDDRAIRESLATALELAGLRGDHLRRRGPGAGRHPRSAHFDVVILDVMMPGVDGLGVCSVLRAEGNRVPILMVTARTETADRVAGLDAGADDYVPKPYDLDELLARMRALLRRVDTQLPPRPPAADPLERDARLEVGPGPPRPGRAAGLGARAARCRCRAPSSTCSSCSCATPGSWWSTTSSTTASGATTSARSRKNLAVFIGYLRRKLDVPGDTLIRSVRGVGYTHAGGLSVRLQTRLAHPLRCASSPRRPS